MRNRVICVGILAHLDIHTDYLDAEIARLERLGADARGGRRRQSREWTGPLSGGGG